MLALLRLKQQYESLLFSFNNCADDWILKWTIALKITFILTI